MAALNPQFKINQIAKDMGLKSKDLTDVLSAKGISDVKTQKTLNEREFSILLQALTEANQVEDIFGYMDGHTHIPSKKAAEKAEAKRLAAEKAAAEKPVPPVMREIWAWQHDELIEQERDVRRLMEMYKR